MTINTLQIANRLKAAEREGRPFEEITLVFGEVEDERYARLVTREHLELELGKIRAEIEKLRLELKHDLTLHLGGMIVAAAAILGGLNVFF
jgi:hypothetical protein